jgi:hypothetical protein
MIYNEKDFLEAIAKSFKAYKEKGARSTAKLKPIHYFVADTLKKIWGSHFEIHYLGNDIKEMEVEGKYYTKNIDITISDNNKPVFCLGIKFVTSNYKQNANNYFENMMGETANIQAVKLPYAQLIILRHKTPYYKKNEKTPSKIEIVNDKDILKYLKLMFDQPQAHRPNCLAIELINIDEKTGKVTLTDLDKAFSKDTAKILKTTLSPENFFREIETYKTYLKIK